MNDIYIPPEQLKIFILDDEAVTVKSIHQALKRDGYKVEGFISGQEALERIQVEPPDLIVMDIRLEDSDGVELMQHMRSLAPDLAVILMTGYASIENAVNATKKGAFHYLEKPFKLNDLRRLIQEAMLEIKQKQQKDRLQKELREAGRFGEIIGASPVMLKLFKTITQVAPLDCNILIQGESGTGKELVARSLHLNSPRATRPFVSFNCGSFSEELIANELFGHEKGAFTGALTTKLGLLETANGGTVFLDEIGEMPQSMQIKLLRVIQERSCLRVGGVKTINLDVRIIAASNRNLEKMVAVGKFRQDLYYRLKVVMIELPPLRQRLEDIPPLSIHFANKLADRFGKKRLTILPEVLEKLASYSFPGNVRELEHIMERAVALNQDGTMRLNDLPPDIVWGPSPSGGRTDNESVPLKDLEMDHILEVYRQCGYNQSETAKKLGISRTTLWRRMREYQQSSNDS
ncbi:MAG: sigma-54-dependent transcriptional regulator [Desulfobulbales bacterium]